MVGLFSFEAKLGPANAIKIDESDRTNHEGTFQSPELAKEK